MPTLDPSTPDTPPTPPPYFYGNADSVESTVALEGNSVGVRDTTVTEALIRADIYINTELEDRGIDIPDTPPNALILAANYYGIADCLQALFAADENPNSKVDYYMKKTDLLLDKYVSIQQTAKDNPNATQGVSSFGAVVTNKDYEVW
jgi:hypothetical protein